ncbi:hypothetical protein GQ54DRAFT_253660 [Martensiomyces pterosporus]|nr:hypothetical protein GQ54DRAFT_253660 [Martensiomyces pterosporus]
MNADIQKLANNMIYDGHLRCGTLKVANKKIKYRESPKTAIDKWPFAQQKPSGQFEMPWVVSALDPKRGAVFIDTDRIPGRESRIDGYDLVQNDTEIRVIKILTSVLQACGVEGRQVGILSPYRIQLKQLEIDADGDKDEGGSANAAHADTQCYTGIEMHTIDRYQGRDADVVIISWVRSNAGQAIGDLLRDWHRINVAITRARYKLIMVGSKSTLLRSPLLAGMLKSIAEDGGLIEIPANSLLPVTTACSRSFARNSSSSSKTAAGNALLNGRPVTSNIIAE